MESEEYAEHLGAAQQRSMCDSGVIFSLKQSEM
jgi:hypothetical protein